MPSALTAEQLAAQTFTPARKRITHADALQQFLNSQAAKDFVSFILALNDAVTGKKASDPAMHISPGISKIQAVLHTLSAWVDEIPPATQSLRYGNPAFRMWFAKVASSAPDLTRSMLPDEVQSATLELVSYLIDAFGNPTRIDYGTGHETTFIALLYCLARLGVLQPEDRQAAVLVVFKTYLQLMRKIQTTYW